MSLYASLIDLFANGPAWAQIAVIGFGLFSMSGPTLIVAGLMNRKPRHRR